MSDQKPKEVKRTDAEIDRLYVIASGNDEDATVEQQVGAARILRDLAKLTNPLPSPASSLPPEVKLPELSKVWLESGGEESYHITALEGGLTDSQAAEVIRRCTDYAALEAKLERMIEALEAPLQDFPIYKLSPRAERLIRAALTASTTENGG